MKRLSNWKLSLIIIAVDILLFGALFFTNNKQTEPFDKQIASTNIQRICELATLDCYYHNVSNWSQPAYNFLGYGEKTVWIEYDGMVRVGINAGKVKISDPDKDGIITVTIPEATILDKDLDENSIKELDREKTVLFFTDWVNAEDRKKALANAQNDMEASVRKNEMILNEARERAKRVVERNIVAIGEAAGKHYTVEFVDVSETSLPSSANDS